MCFLSLRICKSPHQPTRVTVTAAAALITQRLLCYSRLLCRIALLLLCCPASAALPSCSCFSLIREGVLCAVHVLLRPLKHLLRVPCAALPSTWLRPSLWLRSRAVHVPLRPFSAFCGPSCRACPERGSYRPFGFVCTFTCPYAPSAPFAGPLCRARPQYWLLQSLWLRSHARERPSRPLTPFSTPTALQRRSNTVCSPLQPLQRPFGPFNAVHAPAAPLPAFDVTLVDNGLC
jgi:hypothetical protein